MPKERLEILETQQNELAKVVYKIEGTLKNIENAIIQALATKDTVITHSEKLKVTENRLKDLEIENKLIQEKVNGINTKIATWGGAITIISAGATFLINKIF